MAADLAVLPAPKVSRFAISPVDRYDCLLKDPIEKGSTDYEITRWI